MHILQPKHTKLKPGETEKLIQELNISRSQLPKIKSDDPALPEGCKPGDIVKIERRNADGKIEVYYRLII